jgi:hypothetical protein
MHLSGRFRYRTLPRILWSLGALAVVGLIVVLGVKVLPSSSSDAGPPVRPGKPHVDTTPRAVKLSPEVMKVASRFVKTTVMRQDLATGWKLAGPPLRVGMTLAEWKTGNIPVVPFPRGGIAPRVKIAHSYANDALLQLALFPNAGSSQRPQVFFIQLHKYPTTGGKAAWRVTSWAPYASSGSHAVIGN